MEWSTLEEQHLQELVDWCKGFHSVKDFPFIHIFITHFRYAVGFHSQTLLDKQGILLPAQQGYEQYSRYLDSVGKITLQ